MEWELLVLLYESRLWRRSFLWQGLLGLTFEKEYSMVASALELTSAHRVLDLACGPGIYARRFAAELPMAAVTGIDLSWPMLRYAANRSRKARIDNLALVRGDATDLPFRKELFEAVNCCGALHLFPDVGRTLIEVRRVLKGGGRLTLAVFRCGEGAVAQARARIRKTLYGIGSFSRPDLASRLEAAGFIEPRCLHSTGLWLVMSAQKELPSVGADAGQSVSTRGVRR